MGPKVLIITSTDWFFLSHFKERALAARSQGFDVVVACKVGNLRHEIEECGLKLVHVPIARSSINPLAHLYSIIYLVKIFIEIKPDLVHQVALLPIVLGGVARLFVPDFHTINAPVGLGYVFTNNNFLARFLRPVLGSLLWLLLNPRFSKVVFENRDDLQYFIDKRWVRSKDACLIRGAGVRVYEQSSNNRRGGGVTVCLPGRLLLDKGIKEYVEAARLIRKKLPACRFLLAGRVDTDNRSAVSIATIHSWVDEGWIEYVGFQKDMPFFLETVDIVCLPSYREGLPKALLEAMAAGIPCVATDVIGNREVVQHMRNGLLVKPRDPESLAEGIIMLATDEALRRQLGSEGHRLARLYFSNEIICDQTLSLYSSQLMMIRV